VSEKIGKHSEIVSWEAEINFDYKYTLGLAGEVFGDGLREGVIRASRCRRCGSTFLPPQIFCVNCFSDEIEYVDISPVGEVYSYTESGGEVYALIKFPGVSGGLIHRLGELSEPKIGLRVEAKFKPENERRGDITDIIYFKPALP